MLIYSLKNYQIFYILIGLLQKIVMLSRVQPIAKSDIYFVKKNKQPDHLFRLLQKAQSQTINAAAEVDEETKDKIRRHILQKRVDAIVKNGSKSKKISNPEPYLQRKWVSPLRQLHQNEPFDPFMDKKVTKSSISYEYRENLKKIVNILDLNKKLKYCGDYLQVDYDQGQRVYREKVIQKDAKVKFLTKKYEYIEKQLKPKLCIMNYPSQVKATFINYLEFDQYFQQIIRKDDQLIRLLIQSLKISQKFTIKSLTNFYDIFVWQIASRRTQTQFVCKLLMQDLKERSIVQIAKMIDLVCSKINVDQFNKSLDDFNQVVKKLIFGDDYEYSDRREFFLTRRAMVESLEGNEECISIFINVFYAS